MTVQKAPKGMVSSARRKTDIVGVLLALFDFVGELVDVDGLVAEIDELVFVHGDDEALFGDFLDGVGFGDVDFDAGFEDGSGDHEDDQEDEDDVDERDHVDFGEGGLGGFLSVGMVRDPQ